LTWGKLLESLGKGGKERINARLDEFAQDQAAFQEKAGVCALLSVK